MKKVLIIWPENDAGKLLTFIPLLKKKIFFDDIILCSNLNNYKVAFVNEQLNLESIYEIEADYSCYFKKFINLIQKRYSNENVVVVFLSMLETGFKPVCTDDKIIEFINMVEKEGCDLVYENKPKEKRRDRFLTCLIHKIFDFFKIENHEHSSLQAVKLRKLLNLDPANFGKHFKNDLIKKAKKAELFVFSSD